MKMQKRLVLLLLTLSMIAGVFGIFSAAVSGEGITIEGAQIRIEGEQGLRFVAKVEKSKFDLVTGSGANFGIFLIPQSSASAGVLIDKDTDKVMKVPAKNLLTQEIIESVDMTYDPAYIYFSAVLPVLCL